MTTVVATRDRMVCDSKVTHGDAVYHGEKVFRYKGALIGVAGENDETGAFVRWFKQGADPDSAPKMKSPTFDALVLNGSGLFVYAASFHPDVVTDDHYAIGTGAHAALAAMCCGKTAEESVAIACDIDTNSGPPVQTHQLKKPRAPRKGATHG